MKRCLLSFILIIGVFAPSAVFGQKDKPEVKKLSREEQEIFEDAEYFYDQGDYLRALLFYKKLSDSHPDILFFKYKTGICYLYKSDEKEESINYLEEVYKQQPESDDILFYLGRAYHLNYKFDEAINYFTQYLSTDPPVEKKVWANHAIEYCNNGKVLMKSELAAEIKNIGDVVNTDALEFAPVISSDESVLIFTYRGQRSTGGLLDNKFKPDPDGDYYEDIFISNRLGDNWLSPEPIGENINTKGHDASIALSADGQTLFIYKSDPKDKGDIFVSKLQGEIWSTPKRLGSNINTNSWEGSCSLSADGQYLYFASERPGGMGGRDIYVSKIQPDGEWGKAENLGPAINTKYNDDGPFIHPDGISLYFNSEGHNSMGGSDIMYSVLKNGVWSAPTNLGHPINSTEDDRYYVLSADGERGYYSSGKKDGFGQQDIYVVYPGFTGEKPILALVVGVVTADDKPVEATVKVSNAETGEDKGNYRTNSATGKYLIALTPGNKYKIAIEVEGMEPLLEYLDVKSLETFVQVQKDYKLYSEEYKKKNNITVSDTTDLLQVKMDEQITKYRQENTNEAFEARTYNNLLKMKGDEKVENVNYTVELGTFENPADFDSAKFVKMGRIIRTTTPEGNTRFEMGSFETLLDAEIFRTKLSQQDTALKSVVVTVKENGNRKLIQQHFASQYNKKKDYVAPIDTRVIKSKEKMIVALEDDVKYNDMVRDKGKAEIEGLSFKIEIGAVTDTADFKLGYLSKYGKIEKRTYPDGIIRYTFGPFKTLEAAENFKKDLIEKEPAASKSFVTVFYFGERKTVEEFFKETPCDPNTGQTDFAFFVGKDLNDTAIYNKLIATGGNICAEGLIFKVQIGAYRHPRNFKYPKLNVFGKAEIIDYEDGITRFTMREFKNMKDAEVFRQQVIKKGTTDAWITAVYKGKRMLLQDLIAVNFYGRSVN